MHYFTNNKESSENKRSDFITNSKIIKKNEQMINENAFNEGNKLENEYQNSMSKENNTNYKNGLDESKNSFLNSSYKSGMKNYLNNSTNKDVSTANDNNYVMSINEVNQNNNKLNKKSNDLGNFTSVYESFSNEVPKDVYNLQNEKRKNMSKNNHQYKNSKENELNHGTSNSNNNNMENGGEKKQIFSRDNSKAENINSGILNYKSINVKNEFMSFINSIKNYNNENDSYKKNYLEKENQIKNKLSNDNGKIKEEKLFDSDHYMSSKNVDEVYNNSDNIKNPDISESNKNNYEPKNNVNIQSEYKTFDQFFDSGYEQNYGTKKNTSTNLKKNNSTIQSITKVDKNAHSLIIEQNDMHSKQTLSKNQIIYNNNEQCIDYSVEHNNEIYSSRQSDNMHYNEELVIEKRGKNGQLDQSNNHYNNGEEANSEFINSIDDRETPKKSVQNISNSINKNKADNSLSHSNMSMNSYGKLNGEYFENMTGSVRLKNGSIKDENDSIDLIDNEQSINQMMESNIHTMQIANNKIKMNSYYERNNVNFEDSNTTTRQSVKSSYGKEEQTENYYVDKRDRIMSNNFLHQSRNSDDKIKKNDTYEQNNNGYLNKTASENQKSNTEKYNNHKNSILKNDSIKLNQSKKIALKGSYSDYGNTVDILRNRKIITNQYIMDSRSNLLDSNIILMEKNNSYREFKNGIKDSADELLIKSKDTYEKIDDSISRTNNTQINSKYIERQIKSKHILGDSESLRGRKNVERHMSKNLITNMNISEDNRRENYSKLSEFSIEDSRESLTEYDLKSSINNYDAEKSDQSDSVNEYMNKNKEIESKRFYENKKEYLHRSENINRKKIPIEYKKFNTYVNDIDKNADVNLLREFQKSIKNKKWIIDDSSENNQNYYMGKGKNMRNDDSSQKINNNYNRISHNNSDSYNDQKNMNNTSHNRDTEYDQNADPPHINYSITNDDSNCLMDISRISLKNGINVNDKSDNELENSYINFSENAHNINCELEVSLNQQVNKYSNSLNEFSTSINASQTDINISNNFYLTASNISRHIIDIDNKLSPKSNYNYITKLSVNRNFDNTDLQISYIENEIQNKIKEFDIFLGQHFERKCNHVLNRIEKLLSCDFFSNN
ncbi:conserved Plasmodium protein, unknown function [Plasmodium berghei]|uniref:Uncharacterized protein n=3 Tax=Plasmodium berghei TaxID=5821 RepID=A0A509AS02_PLABA|nr:conserved Plasmodium protein, unknown function [Plasmodium berghei ANKA]CXJ19772.1 conserved Plasmodium protein, unknown function [Plasmodium berghei]VUC58376.1 conserved Plasmodium protein, unknown function [Plasmodium berghei ANKA]|eukprot:XP_034424139.1 conserved Plasmodium protein, unknown function [Plasmodium berghei ANKA]